jgi:Ion channel
MFAQLGIGGLMIGLTTIIHASFMLAAISLVGWVLRHARLPMSHWRAAVTVSWFVLVMFCATIVEVWAWAALFVWGGALPNIEEATYFSVVTFSTLGYGDIVLDPGWRLLGSIAAVNGVILFGWTTALVFIVVQRVYTRDGAGTRF